jgi:hypothetical protein
MEPDAMALQQLLATGREKLGKKAFEQTRAQGYSLRLEEAIAQVLPSGA